MRYGDGLNNDGAAYVGDQKTKQQLTPNMMSHYALSQMHFASGNIPMGMMEQMKGDMLKQQIQVNKESADKNRESEKLLYDYQDKKVDLPGGPTNTQVRTVDKDRASAKVPVDSMAPASTQPQAGPSFGMDESPASAPVASEPSTPKATPTEQLAVLGPAQEPAPIVESTTTAAFSEAASASLETPANVPDWQKDLEGLSGGNSDPRVTPILPENNVTPGLDFGLARNVIKKDGKKDKDGDPFASIGKDRDKDKITEGRRGSRRSKLAKRTRVIAGAKD